MSEPLQTGEQETLPIDLEYLGEDTDVVKIMEQCAQDARTTERTESERDWRINLAWFSGEPWFKRNTQGDIEWIRPEHRANRFHLNIIFPRVMTLAGNETYFPKFEGRAGASQDLSDIQRVRAAGDAVNHACRVSHFDKAIREGHVYKHNFGHCWYRIGFDPNAGPMGPTWGQVACPKCNGVGAIVSPLDGLPGPCDACGAVGIHEGPPDLAPADPGFIYDVTGESPAGELLVDICPPWEIYSDPDAPSLFESQWILHERDMDRDLAWVTFCQNTGIHAKDLEASSFVTQMERLFSTSMNSARRGSARKNQVRVREFFKLRSERHPHGLYGAAIGGKLIRAGKLPYTHNKIPYVPLRCHMVPGKLYPKSTVDNLLPTAVAYNDLATTLFSRAQQSVHLRVLAPRGSAFALSDIDGIIEWDAKPSRPPPMFFNDSGATPDAAQMMERLLKQADDISFANDVLRGEASGSDDNARFSALREQRAINPLKIMIDDNADSFQRIGRLLLDTMKVCYKDGRMLRSVFGATGVAKFRAWKLEQVGEAGNVDMLPVRDVGRTLASRRQDLYEAQKAGVLADPKLMRLAEFSQEDGVYAEQEMHESAAQMENERIRQRTFTPQMMPQPQPPPPPPPQPGMQPSPMPPPVPPVQFEGIDAPQRYEDHGIHLRSHGFFLAELRMTLGIQDPAVQALVNHMALHEMQQAWEQVNAQQQQQQAASGLGLANAADISVQPQQAVQGAQASGAIDQSSLNPAGEPGPPGTQPALKQIDQSLRGQGGADGGRTLQ